MSGFLLLDAMLFVLCAASSLKFRKAFGLICPFLIISATLLIYIFGVAAGSFVPGYIAICVAGIALFASVLIDVAVRRKILLSDFRRYCLTTGSVSFVIFSCLCLLIARMHGADLVYWDEFAHWGQMAKELFRLDAFYTVDHTALLYHNDYPPAIPLWEAMCNKAAGKWDGRYMYASLWLLQLSLFLPFLELAGNKAKSISTKCALIAAVLLFCVLFVPCFDGGAASFWLSIYIDTVLALLFGLGLYLALQPRKSKSIRLAISVLLCFLILVKQSSLFFVGCVVVALVLALVFLEPKEDRKLSILFCVMSVIGCIAFYLSWKYVLSLSTLPSAQGQFSIPVNGALSLPVIVLGGGTAVQGEIVSLFARALLERSLAPYLFFDVAYASASLFLLVAIVIAGTVFRVRARTVLCCVGLYAFIAASYAVFMLIMYLFSFSETDGLSLVCFERYMNTVLVGMYMSAFLLFLHFGLCLSRGFSGLPSLTVLALCVSLILSPLAMLQIRTETNTSAKEFALDGETLIGAIPEGSSVFVVNQGGNPFETLEIAYYATGLKISREVEGGLFSADSLSWGATKEQMVDMLSDEDYLYAKCIDQDFLNKYQPIFSETLESGGIYSIDAIKGNTIVLSKIH